MNNQLQKLSVLEIFSNGTYIVPIYQRNYAWESSEIEQLLEDIADYHTNEADDSSYFLGNLIVNQTKPQHFAVVDGQQRLTTLYLLEKYLKIDIPSESLHFEIRSKSNHTLQTLHNISSKDLGDSVLSPEIVRGFKIIDSYFKSNKVDQEEFKKKLHNVFLVRVELPKGTDLNHYFEIMNTRGEQLELHEIAKARFMGVLTSANDKNTAHVIWEKCADMHTYLQMSFEVKMRNQLFQENWSELKESITTFDAVRDLLIDDKDELMEQKSLLAILEETRSPQQKNPKNEQENERFESILSFPNFLLQVNAVLNFQDEENEGNLDDKKLLKILEKHWEDADKAKVFLFAMLKIRLLFDKYIIKREFARNYKETGRWSLQKLLNKGDNKPYYLATCGTNKNSEEEEDPTNNKLLRTLQSCLRVTYTSPKTMHWITLALSQLYCNEETNLIDQLENYGKNKVNSININQTSGFGFERIVFTYLDYLLYRDGYNYNGKEIIPKQSEDWEFQFRTSIEHFYPQHPSDLDRWQEQDVHSFGNLALISVKDNARFSNLSPLGKIDTYPNIIDQSLKLKIMAKMTNESKAWTTELANKHQTAMFHILSE